MTVWSEWIKEYSDQTGDFLLFVWRLQIWLAMNFIAIKSKFYKFPLLHGLTSNPCHDTYNKIPKISPSMYKPPKPVTQKTLR